MSGIVDAVKVVDLLDPALDPAPESTRRGVAKRRKPRWV